jgi:hypothetical protein
MRAAAAAVVQLWCDCSTSDWTEGSWFIRIKKAAALWYDAMRHATLTECGHRLAFSTASTCQGNRVQAE